MKRYSLVEFARPLRLCDDPDPVPQGTEVVLDVECCGLCHSDLHLQQGYYDLGGGKQLTLADRGIKPPLTMGHEVVGRLSKTGPGASDFADQIGRRFIVFPWLGCGACFRCREGDENLCTRNSFIGVHKSGGQAEKIVVPSPAYLVDARNLDPAQAATLACSGLTSFAALGKLGLDPARDWLMLIGYGGVGQSTYALARALGYANLAVADLSPAKRKAAEVAGADLVVDPADPAAILALTGLDRGLAGVIDLVGSAATVEFSIATLRRGGEYVMVGMYGGELSLPLPVLPSRALSLTGSYVGTLRQLQDLVELVTTHGIRLVSTETIPFSAVNEGMERLRHGDVEGRLVVDMSLG